MAMLSAERLPPPLGWPVGQAAHHYVYAWLAGEPGGDTPLEEEAGHGPG